MYRTLATTTGIRELNRAIQYSPAQHSPQWLVTAGEPASAAVTVDWTDCRADTRQCFCGAVQWLQPRHIHCQLSTDEHTRRPSRRARSLQSTPPRQCQCRERQTSRPAGYAPRQQTHAPPLTHTHSRHYTHTTPHTYTTSTMSVIASRRICSYTIDTYSTPHTHTVDITHTLRPLCYDYDLLRPAQCQW